MIDVGFRRTNVDNLVADYIVMATQELDTKISQWVCIFYDVFQMMKDFSFNIINYKSQERKKNDAILFLALLICIIRVSYKV